MALLDKISNVDCKRLMIVAVFFLGTVIFTSVCISTFGQCWTVNATEWRGYMVNSCTGEAYFLQEEAKYKLRVKPE